MPMTSAEFGKLLTEASEKWGPSGEERGNFGGIKIVTTLSYLTTPRIESKAHISSAPIADIEITKEAEIEGLPANDRFRG